MTLSPGGWPEREFKLHQGFDTLSIELFEVREALSLADIRWTLGQVEKLLELATWVVDTSTIVEDLSVGSREGLRVASSISPVHQPQLLGLSYGSPISIQLGDVIRAAAEVLERWGRGVIDCGWLIYSPQSRRSAIEARSAVFENRRKEAELRGIQLDAASAEERRRLDTILREDERRVRREQLRDQYSQAIYELSPEELRDVFLRLPGTTTPSLEAMSGEVPVRIRELWAQYQAEEMMEAVWKRISPELGQHL